MGVLRCSRGCFPRVACHVPACDGTAAGALALATSLTASRAAAASLPRRDSSPNAQAACLLSTHVAAATDLPAAASVGAPWLQQDPPWRDSLGLCGFLVVRAAPTCSGGRPRPGGGLRLPPGPVRRSLVGPSMPEMSNTSTNRRGPVEGSFHLSVSRKCCRMLGANSV